MDETKIDCLPAIEHVIGISELYDRQFHKGEFSKDQKPEFYLGMVAAIRMFVIYLKYYEENKHKGETLEQLEIRVHMLNSDVAKIILDKYDLNGFKP